MDLMQMLLELFYTGSRVKVIGRKSSYLKVQSQFKKEP